MAKKKRAGRPPAGLVPGEKSSAYQQLTLRIPREPLGQLNAVAGVLRLPRWRVVVQAVAAYVGDGPGLTDEQRRAVRAVLKAHTAAG